MPDAKSRDQIGKATQVSLRAYFNSMYGDDDSVLFQKVRVCLDLILILPNGYLDVVVFRRVQTSSRACRLTH